MTVVTVLFSRLIDLRTGNALAYLVAIGAFLTAAMRPTHFPDLDTYQLMFDAASTGDFSDPLYWALHGEPGFKIFSYFLYSVGINFSGFLVVMSLISFFLLTYISRLGKIPFSYLWLAYFSFYFITRDMGITRMAIASHLIVIFFLHRRFFWKSFSILIATLSFQYFALAAILINLFTKIKIYWFTILLLFLISFGLSGFINFESVKFVLSVEQANNYGDTNIMQAGPSSIIVPIFRNLFFAFFLYFFMKNEINYKYYRIWIWSAFFSAAFYILASGILLVAQRFSAYFGVIIPIAMAYLMQRNSQKMDTFLLVFFLCILNFISVFYFNSWLWA